MLEKRAFPRYLSSLSSTLVSPERHVPYQARLVDISRGGTLIELPESDMSSFSDGEFRVVQLAGRDLIAQRVDRRRMAPGLRIPYRFHPPVSQQEFDELRRSYTKTAEHEMGGLVFRASLESELLHPLAVADCIGRVSLTVEAIYRIYGSFYFRANMSDRILPIPQFTHLQMGSDLEIWVTVILAVAKILDLIWHFMSKPETPPHTEQISLTLEEIEKIRQLTAIALHTLTGAKDALATNSEEYRTLVRAVIPNILALQAIISSSLNITGSAFDDWKIENMATPIGHKPTDRSYLGNMNNMEVHDLRHETPQCRIDEIIQAGYAVVFTPDTLEQAHREGCNNCIQCLGASRS